MHQKDCTRSVVYQLGDINEMKRNSSINSSNFAHFNIKLDKDNNSDCNGSIINCAAAAAVSIHHKIFI